MTDEKYVYTQDVRDKKITARSARNKRTHNGKGGAVKFPSDFMTRKEIEAMNGEVKSYKLNAPMTWNEFKAIPDDIKVIYIKALRSKFGVPDTHIAKMFGIGQNMVSKEVIRLGINMGKHRSGRTHWDKEGWLVFVNGAPVPAADPVEESFKEDVEKGLASLEEICEPVPVPEIKTLPVREETAKVIPRSGTMTLEGRIEDVLNTVSVLLGGANVSLCVSWEVLPERACEE